MVCYERVPIMNLNEKSLNVTHIHWRWRAYRRRNCMLLEYMREVFKSPFGKFIKFVNLQSVCAHRITFLFMKPMIWTVVSFVWKCCSHRHTICSYWNQSILPNCWHPYTRPHVLIFEPLNPQHESSPPSEPRTIGYLTLQCVSIYLENNRVCILTCNNSAVWSLSPVCWAAAFHDVELNELRHFSFSSYILTLALFSLSIYKM